MKSVFEIYSELNIPHKIVLEDFLQDYFFFLPQLDPSILDQMTDEEICDTDAFYNNDNIQPIQFLLKHNKISMRGFDHVMHSELYMSNSTDKKMLGFYYQLFDFIKTKKVDITKYFREDHVATLFTDFLEYARHIDINVLYDNLVLEDALDNSNSIALLLFGFKVDDLPQRRAKMMEYICENFESISEKFINSKNSYKTNSSFYSPDSFGYIPYSPLAQVAEYIEDKYGLLSEKYKNEELILEHVRAMIRNSKFDELGEFIELIKEEYPRIYDEVKNNKSYKSYTVSPKTLKVEGLTVEELHAFLENCTETDRHEVVTNLEYYKEVNKTGFNYEYGENKFYTEYTPEFLNFQLDECIRILKLKEDFEKEGKREEISSKWEFKSHFLFKLLVDVIHFNTKGNSWHELFEKALNIQPLQKKIISYIEDNGSLEIMNLVYFHAPELIKMIKNEKLIYKIIVNEHNKILFGKW